MKCPARLHSASGWSRFFGTVVDGHCITNRDSHGTKLWRVEAVTEAVGVVGLVGLLTQRMSTHQETRQRMRRPDSNCAPVLTRVTFSKSTLMESSHSHHFTAASTRPLIQRRERPSQSPARSGTANTKMRRNRPPCCTLDEQDRSQQMLNKLVEQANAGSRSDRSFQEHMKPR